MKLNKKTTSLLFSVNKNEFLLSHRKNLIEKAIELGWKVYVASPSDDFVSKVEDLGAVHLPLKISAWGSKPIRELKTIYEIYKLYSSIKPDIVHNVTIKPVIYGTIAGRLAGISRIVNAIPGMGQVFSASGISASIRRTVVKAMYKIAFYNCEKIKVIFQNPNDKKYFVKNKLVSNSQCYLVPGAGVEDDVYSMSSLPEDGVKVLYSGRILKNKGTQVFAEAAKILKEKGSKAKFIMAGKHEPENPGSVDIETYDQWRKSNYLEVVGHVTNIPELLKNSNIVCLPSFYGEGVPRALIEAAASGRPVIGADAPGCREIVLDGVNGYLCEPNNADDLANKIEKIVEDKNLAINMGLSSRELFESGGFSSRNVVARTFEVYSEVTNIDEQYIEAKEATA